jgi:hypothetical protein
MVLGWRLPLPEDEAADPLAISFFGADGGVEEAYDLTALVHAV